MDMTIALAVLDDGISNAIQAQTGKTAVYEHDFSDGDGETDGGVVRNHGSGVAYAALRTSAAYNLVDLKRSMHWRTESPPVTTSTPSTCRSAAPSAPTTSTPASMP
jgi:hypothetical protein